MHDALHTLLQKNDPPSLGWRVSERERERGKVRERRKKEETKLFFARQK